MCEFTMFTWALLKLKSVVESILSLKDNTFVPNTLPIFKLSFAISAKQSDRKKVKNKTINYLEFLKKLLGLMFKNNTQ